MLISIDTLRADHLGCYGDRGARTPNVDGLASEGSLFEDATTPAPITAPSHASLLTGLYPPQHGVRSNGLFRLDPKVPTLAEALEKQGFRTGAVIGGFPLVSRFGFSQGFELFDETLTGGEEAERPASEVASVAIRFIEARSRDDRFFLFVHFYDAHADYRSHPGIEGLAPYDGEIAYVDQAVGRILETLRSRGLWSQTATILASDHGEGLGEHGEETHSVFVYQATLHVPLIIRGPDLPAGRRIAEPVSLVDVAPTAMDVLGLPALDAAAGESLVPAIRGQIRSAPRALYFESLLPEVEFRWAPLRGVRKGDLKLISAPRPELYALSSDPGEGKNLYGQPEGRDLLTELGQMESRLSPVGTASTTPVIDEEARRKLESLGYVGGDGGPAGPQAPDPKDRIGVLDQMVHGLREFKAGRFDAAEATYREALDRDPGNAVLMKNLGRSVASLGRTDEAREILAKAEEAAVSPGLKADVLQIRADLALGHGDPQSARDDAKRAIELDPRLSRAIITLASAERLLGNTDRALGVLGDALKADTRDAGILVALAETEMAAGRNKEARDHLEEALRLEQGHGRAHYDLGLLLQSDKPDEALRELEMAHAALPHEGEVTRQLAQAYAGAGRLESAVALLGARLEEVPGDDDSRYVLAVCLSRAGKLSEAIELLRSLVGARPASAEVWNALGTALARSGDYVTAITSFEKAVELAPSSRDYRENLGQAYLASGKKELGEAELARARSLPGSG